MASDGVEAGADDGVTVMLETGINGSNCYYTNAQVLYRIVAKKPSRT